MKTNSAIEYLDYRQLIVELESKNNTGDYIDEKYIDIITHHFDIIGEPIMPDDVAIIMYSDDLFSFELNHEMIRNGDSWDNLYTVYDFTKVNGE